MFFTEIKTIQNDEQYLRQISTPIDLKDPNLEFYISVLREYFKEKPSLAMAAVQLGISKRIIYIRNTDFQNLTDHHKDESQILINPKIMKMEGHTRYWEACASCLDLMGLVDRPYTIELEYFQPDGKLERKIFTGFEATVLAHEYDHLDGIFQYEDFQN